MKDDLRRKAIAANIEAMRQQLSTCFLRSCEAFQAIQAGEQNQAIGAILDIHHQLEDVLALYRAALALHRRADSAPELEDGRTS
jgi:hypothetical protein